MAPDRFCPQCGCALPAGRSHDTCPACLLRAGLERESGSPAWPLDRSGTVAFQDAIGSEPSSVGKVLESLANSIGSIPRVLLPDTVISTTSPSPSSTPTSETRALGEPSDRYQLFWRDRLRRYWGRPQRPRDGDLGRDLAVKVLLEEHRATSPARRAGSSRRAQIGGQLQHPGIVPVYELGALADRRPYFTMKLVKGRTLAAR